MKFFLAFLFVCLIGCVTAPNTVNTVVEKFVRGVYAETSGLEIAKGQWTPIILGHMATYWVVVQRDGYRLEKAMLKEDWDRIKIGDVVLSDIGEGGT